jgi:DNA (cytosine-5)-methyltransferase 1
MLLPPCKKYSQAISFHPGASRQHVSLIEPLRERLQASGLPYIIENVERAPLHNPIKLCGAMFGLRVYRHRLFESNMLLLQPSHIKHRVKAAPPGAIAREDEYWCVGGHFGHKEEAQAAMGIDWMCTVNEIAQAIPPAYTEWIGRQVLSFVA